MQLRKRPFGATGQHIIYVRFVCIQSLSGGDDITTPSVRRQMSRYEYSAGCQLSLNSDTMSLYRMKITRDVVVLHRSLPVTPCLPCTTVTVVAFGPAFSSDASVHSAVGYRQQ